MLSLWMGGSPFINKQASKQTSTHEILASIFLGRRPYAWILTKATPLRCVWLSSPSQSHYMSNACRNTTQWQALPVMVALQSQRQLKGLVCSDKVALHVSVGKLYQAQPGNLGSCFWRSQVHNNIQLVRCVHALSNRFENKDS